MVATWRLIFRVSGLWGGKGENERKLVWLPSTTPRHKCTDLFLPLSLPFKTMSNDLGLEKSIIDQLHSYNSMGHPLRSNSLFVHSLLSKDSFQMEVLNIAWWWHCRKHPPSPQDTFENCKQWSICNSFAVPSKSRLMTNFWLMASFLFCFVLFLNLAYW